MTELGPEIVRLLRTAAELLSSAEDTELRRQRDEVATALLDLAQTSCPHARRFRGVCADCLAYVGGQA
jgi:hypothetical protein